MTQVKSGHNKRTLTSPTIKNQAKFVKNVQVPKSARVSGNTEGDFGRGR